MDVFSRTNSSNEIGTESLSKAKVEEEAFVLLLSSVESGVVRQAVAVACRFDEGNESEKEFNISATVAARVVDCGCDSINVWVVVVMVDIVGVVVVAVALDGDGAVVVTESGDGSSVLFTVVDGVLVGGGGAVAAVTKGAFLEFRM